MKKKEGVLDFIPTWLPEANRIEIDEAVSQTLRQEYSRQTAPNKTIHKNYSKEDIHYFMHQLSKMVDEGGSQGDFPHTMTPSTKHPSLGRVARLTACPLA